MRSSRLRGLVSVSVVALVSGALAGCAPAHEPPPAAITHEPSSPTPTPDPTPTWPPALPDNALFQITATMTGGNGATAHLTQTVFEPSSDTANGTDALDANCDAEVFPTTGWRKESSASLFLDATFVATLEPGSPQFLKEEDAVIVGLWGWQAYSGPYQPAQSYCSSGWMGIPGDVAGTGFVPMDDPALGENRFAVGWAMHPEYYGFLANGNYPADYGYSPLSGDAVVSDCFIQLSTEAETVVASLDSWAGRQVTGPYDCSPVSIDG
jgi:hypothetical protein